MDIRKIREDEREAFVLLTRYAFSDWTEEEVPPERLAFAHTGFFTSEPAEALADLLIKHAPGKLDRVYFVSGGSEATEAALKLARQYHIERGEPERANGDPRSRQQRHHEAGRAIGRAPSTHGSGLPRSSAARSR